MKYVPNALSATVGRTLLHGQKHSPKLLFAAGIVGMGTTVVLACKATLEVEPILAKAEAEMNKIDYVSTSADYAGQYSEGAVKRDKTKVVIRTTVELTRLYGPALICGSLTVAALAGSHNILSKRNAALTAAYGTISKAFDDYRGRVRGVLGDEREREIYQDAQPCEMEDPQTGKKVKALRNGGGSPYSRLYDEFNVNFQSTPEYNLTFLKLQQAAATQRLQAKGHLFLNEVYDALGLPRSKEGQVVGWLARGGKDGYVDFGLFDGDDGARFIDFMAGREKAVWLDFNVDGVIYDKI